MGACISGLNKSSWLVSKRFGDSEKCLRLSLTVKII